MGHGVAQVQLGLHLMVAQIGLVVRQNAWRGIGYDVHKSTPSLFVLSYHTPAGVTKRHPAMAGVLGIVGYFRKLSPPRTCAILLDEHERLGCRLGRPLGQVPAAPSHGLVEALASCPSVTAAAVPAPKGEPSRQLTRGLQKAKSRLPLGGGVMPKA